MRITSYHTIFSSDFCIILPLESKFIQTNIIMLSLTIITQRHSTECIIPMMITISNILIKSIQKTFEGTMPQTK